MLRQHADDSHRRRWLWHALVCLVVILFPCGNSIMAEDISRSRTLNFPQDRSLGMLFRPDHKYDDAIWFNWESIGDARGPVDVPAKTRLRLDVTDLTAENTAALLALPGGLIEQLRVVGDCDAESLAKILHHHRVTQLCLRSPMTDAVASAIAQSDSITHLLPAHGGITGAQVAIVAQSRSIESMHIGGPQLTDDCVGSIAAMPALKSLILGNADIGDEGIVRLAKHPTLESFKGHGIDLSDRAVAALATLPNLRSLVLSQMHNVTDEGISHLAGATHLESIQLDNTKVTATGLNILADLPRLKRISTPSPLDNAGINAVMKMRHIEHLYSGWTTADEAHLAKLANIQSLTNLNLGGKHLTDAVVEKLAHLPHLKTLWLQNAPVSDTGLFALAAHTDLEGVLLGNLNITSRGVMALSTMKSLSYLTIIPSRGDNHRISLAGIEQFSALKWLVVHQGVTDDDMKSIGKIRQLERLDIGGDITNDGLAHISGLPNLWQLSLHGSKLTDDGLKHLTTLPKLSLLSIGGDITDEGVAHLKNVPTLTVVYFASQTISDGAIEDLQAALPLHPTVRKSDGQPIQAAPKVGDDAPLFDVELVTGSTFKLADQRGKAVLLYFWADWCSPCVAATDQLEALHAELAEKHGDAFVMLSLSQAVDAYRTRRFAERHQLAWPQAHIGMGSEIASKYGVNGAPFYFIIGPDGKLASNSGDWNELRAAIAACLANR